jgi:hypothetical protein
MRRESEKKKLGHAHDGGGTCCGLSVSQQQHRDLFDLARVSLEYEFHVVDVHDEGFCLILCAVFI